MKIHRFELGIGQTQVLVPRGAMPFAVNSRGTEIHVWARVEPANPFAELNFLLLPTGAEWPESNKVYLGTVQYPVSGDFMVWHVFFDMFSSSFAPYITTSIEEMLKQ